MKGVQKLYENSTNIIFNCICKRLNERKEELNISTKDLIPDNPNLSSTILHNRKEPKKNPYLIPDTHISAIMSSLNFKSIKELLFGTDEEIESYAYSLFHALIIDTLEMDKDDKLKAIKKYGKIYDYDIFDKLESVLRDYIPYALMCIYVENPDLSSFVFSEELSEVIDRGILIKDEAIKRLYEDEYIKYSFTIWFIDNIVKRDSVVRLDKAFLDFVIMHLLPRLITVTSDEDMYSLGNRVYKALTNLLNEWEFHICNNLESRILISEREEYEKTVINGLIDAEYKHALNLYELQKSLTGANDIEELYITLV